MTLTLETLPLRRYASPKAVLFPTVYASVTNYTEVPTLFNVFLIILPLFAQKSKRRPSILLHALIVDTTLCPSTGTIHLTSIWTAQYYTLANIPALTITTFPWFALGTTPWSTIDAILTPLCPWYPSLFYQYYPPLLLMVPDTLLSTPDHSLLSARLDGLLSVIPHALLSELPHLLLCLLSHDFLPVLPIHSTIGAIVRSFTGTMLSSRYYPYTLSLVLSYTLLQVRCSHLDTTRGSGLPPICISPYRA